jgi:hypothetical protein
MTLEQAINILHPDTTVHALRFRQKDEAQNLVDEACLVACEVMRKEIEKQQKAREERL